MSTPEEIKKHDSIFQNGSWRNYNFEELGSFVHLLTKRAKHRTEYSGANKDLQDAKNYLSMMEAKLEELSEDVMSKFKPKGKE